MRLFFGQVGKNVVRFITAVSRNKTHNVRLNVKFGAFSWPFFPVQKQKVLYNLSVRV